MNKCNEFRINLVQTKDFHANPIPDLSPELPPKHVKPATRPKPFLLEVDVRGKSKAEEWSNKVRVMIFSLMWIIFIIVLFSESLKLVLLSLHKKKNLYLKVLCMIISLSIVSEDSVTIVSENMLIG